VKNKCIHREAGSQDNISLYYSVKTGVQVTYVS